MRWCIDIQKGRKPCWHRNGQRFHGILGTFLRIWIVGLDGELVSRTISDIFVKDMSQTGILGAHQIDVGCRACGFVGNTQLISDGFINDRTAGIPGNPNHVARAVNSGLKTKKNVAE